MAYAQFTSERVVKEFGLVVSDEEDLFGGVAPIDCHELLLRVALIANNLDDWVVSHPACLQHAD